jgi:hypothetical protein
MTQTFHGTWSIQVSEIHAGFAQRFIISGSAGSDGIYPGVVGTLLPQVSGSQWTVRMEWNDNVSSGWQPSDVRRSASYTVQHGLVVLLGADDGFPANRDHDYNDMILSCVNLEPEVNPFPPGPPPFDFSLPKSIIVRRSK